MPAFRNSISLGIAGTNNNVLQGTQVEYNSQMRPVRCIIAGASDQADVKMGVRFGDRQIADPSSTLVPVQPGANQGPNIPDHIVVDAVVYPGERIYVSLQGGAAASVNRIFVQTA